MPEPPDDLLDTPEPLDPRQWAIHGLLRAYFGSQHGESETRARRILERLGIAAGAAVGPGERRRIWRFPLVPRMTFRRWAVGGSLAAAAAILIAVGILTLPASERQAIAADAANATVWVPDVVTLPVLVDQYGDEIVRYAAVRDARMREAERLAATLRDPALDDCTYWRLYFLRSALAASLSFHADRALHAWHEVYRRKRALGDWDDSLREVRDALAYCQDNPTGEPFPARRFVCLDDLGSTCMAMGDFGGAREAYTQSIRERQNAADHSAYPRVERCAHSLPVLYWRLHFLSLLERDWDGARNALRDAQEILRDWFLAVCAANPESSKPLPDSPDLLTAFHAMPAAFQDPPALHGEQGDAYDHETRAHCHGFAPQTSLVMMLRGHLYQAARFSRVTGDLDRAEQLLGEARALPYFKRNDEYRVLFFEPLEAARIAIGRKAYAHALKELDQAEQNSGPLEDPDDPDLDRPAISPAYRCEVTFLRGLALLGLNRNPDECAAARHLIAEALQVPQQMAQHLPADQREKFLSQFRPWEDLANGAR